MGGTQQALGKKSVVLTCRRCGNQIQYSSLAEEDSSGCPCCGSPQFDATTFESTLETETD